ncbi:MauE/DoxX family redox-associated membrane protein [Pimelobacter simplex]|uniref:MauE/DoxX family redox-associated membrane protein n=1 Tax=Nocardioides simplex TaxID=2045 RepID=UPI003AAD62AD
MTSLLSGAAAMSGAVMALVSGVVHLRRPGELRMAMAAHRLLPDGVLGTVARAFPVVLVTVGAGLAVALAAGQRELLAVATAGGVVVYSSIVLYAGMALVTSDGARCGCFGSRDRLDRFTIVRALVPLGGCAHLLAVGAAPGLAARVAAMGLGCAAAAVLVLAPRWRDAAEARALGPARS